MSSGAALATSGDGSVTAPDIAEAVFRKLAGAGLPAEALRLVALPGGTQTRWLLPAGERGIGSVLASWTPYRVWPRLAWSVVRAASGVRRTAALPGVAAFDVEGIAATSWQSLGWRWSGVPIPVIYVGTPGPNRKAVVHLVEPATSQCRAVVKVPLTDEAKAAILHEAGVLQALQRDRYPHAPRLLYTDPARGISTQTFIAGRPGTRKLAPDYFRPSERSCGRTKQLPSQPTPIGGHPTTTRPGPSVNCATTPHFRPAGSMETSRPGTSAGSPTASAHCSTGSPPELTACP